MSEAIESILKQTFHDFEFIIFNDGSEDSSSHTIEKYAKLDSRIVSINQKNIGLTRSLNNGIKLAREYIARQDADDVSYQERLETTHLPVSVVMICVVAEFGILIKKDIHKTWLLVA